MAGVAASCFLCEQPKAPEACVPLAADHQMVVDGNAERFCGPEFTGEF